MLALVFDALLSVLLCVGWRVRFRVLSRVLTPTFKLALHLKMQFIVSQSHLTREIVDYRVTKKSISSTPIFYVNGANPRPKLRLALDRWCVTDSTNSSTTRIRVWSSGKKTSETSLVPLSLPRLAFTRSRTRRHLKRNERFVSRWQKKTELGQRPSISLLLPVVNYLFYIL